MLYDSERFKLAEGKELTPEQRHKTAQEDFRIYFKDFERISVRIPSLCRQKEL